MAGLEQTIRYGGFLLYCCGVVVKTTHFCYAEIRVWHDKRQRMGVEDCMKLLVIGGSYFFGRVFVMESTEHEITVVNRGTYSMAEYGALQVTGDRHDRALWRGITQDFDVVIDFCAYEKGDIAFVLEHMGGKIGQYILISTVDVYERGKSGLMAEDTAFEKRLFQGEAGSYIAGKVALEEEIRQVCGMRNIPWTVLRPAILYGPYNYAPRESYFVQLMVQNKVLPIITDATGQFQFLYVKDAALAVKACLLNPKTFGQAYNLCGDEILNYERFAKELERQAEPDVQFVRMTANQARRQGILLPFPVDSGESHLCSNEKSRKQLKISYTEFACGMEKMYHAFARVYGSLD